jgi:hypothetical protein
MSLFFGLIVSCNPTTVQQQPPGPATRDALKQDAFDKKLICHERGRRLYESEFKNPGGGQSPLNPQFAYSEKLNSCVMFAGFLGNNGTVSEFLIDVLSNIEIASSSRNPRGTFGLSKQDFETKKKEFFP